MVTQTIGQANPKPKIHMKTIKPTISLKLWDTIQPNFKNIPNFKFDQNQHFRKYSENFSKISKFKVVMDILKVKLTVLAVDWIDIQAPPNKYLK